MCLLAEAKSIGWTMSAFEKPQIITHIQKGLNYTVFDCKWVPCSAKFVTMGNFARGTGVIQLYEIQQGDLKLLREVGAGSRLPSSKIWDCRWGESADLGGRGVCIPFGQSVCLASPQSSARAAREKLS